MKIRLQITSSSIGIYAQKGVKRLELVAKMGTENHNEVGKKYPLLVHFKLRL